MSSNPNHNANTNVDSDEELWNDDSDDQMFFEILQQQQMLLQHIGSSSSAPTRRKRRVVERDREGGHSRLVADYFSEKPTYPSDIFRRRFRMRRGLFTRIVDALSRDDYFKWRVDATGRQSFSPLQKCTVAIRQLAYGGPGDQFDEYLRIGETTAIESLFNFCRCVIDIFGERYLRKPTIADCERLLLMHEQRHGFPGMLGSLDCMHWEWKNCPVAWKGQFTRGDHGTPTIMLEAVASADLWIWHAFFGVAGSNNDINVLNQSPLFSDVLKGKGPEIDFKVNDRQYTRGYYLTDGIYPEWATFVKSFQCPHDPKKALFKKMQEAARKDVERAFGVLQARWAMIRGPGRFWYQSNLKDIMYTCIILHNMIIEDEGDTAFNWSEEPDDNNTIPEIFQGPVGGFNEYSKRRAALHDKQMHQQLRSDLIEHVWARYQN